MTTLILAALLALQQAPNPDPDLSSRPELGASLRKPAKNDDWEFKPTGGFFSNSRIAVGHKVEPVFLDVLIEDKGTGVTMWDPRGAAENTYRSLATTQGVTDARMQPIKSSKLPGGGASNAQAQLLDMTFKRDGKDMELRMWVFVGKQNGNLFSVSVTGEAGTYKKHQKVLDAMLATLQTFKAVFPK